MGNSIQSVVMQNWRGGNGPLLGVDTAVVNDTKTMVQPTYVENSDIRSDMMGVALIFGVLGMVFIAAGLFKGRGV